MPESVNKTLKIVHRYPMGARQVPDPMLAHRDLQAIDALLEHTRGRFDRDGEGQDNDRRAFLGHASLLQTTSGFFLPGSLRATSMDFSSFTVGTWTAFELTSIALRFCSASKAFAGAFPAAA